MAIDAYLQIDGIEGVRKALQAGGAHFNEYGPPHYGKLYGLTSGAARLSRNSGGRSGPLSFHSRRCDGDAAAQGRQASGPRGRV